MSAEANALRVLRASKASTVPFYCLLWTSFRCHVNSALVSGKPSALLSVSGPAPPAVHADELKAELTRCMRRSSPKGFRGTSSNAKWYQRSEGVPLWTGWHRLLIVNDWFYLAQTGDNRGMGLFARKDLSFSRLQKVLFGWLCPISEADYEQLHAAGHPSLFQRGRRRYVFIGPLCCANHACDSLCGFAAPKHFPVPGYATPSFAPESNSSEWDAQLLTLRDLSGAADDNRGFRAGEEILVRYQDDFPDCQCGACQTPSAPPRKRLK